MDILLPLSGDTPVFQRVGLIHLLDSHTGAFIQKNFGLTSTILHQEQGHEEEGNHRQ